MNHSAAGKAAWWRGEEYVTGLVEALADIRIEAWSRDEAAAAAR